MKEHGVRLPITVVFLHYFNFHTIIIFGVKNKTLRNGLLAVISDFEEYEKGNSLILVL